MALWPGLISQFLSDNATGDYVDAMLPLDNGEVIITGGHQAENGDKTNLTYKIYSNGNDVQSTRYQVDSSQNSIGPSAITIDKFGDLFLTGNFRYLVNQENESSLLITKLDGTNGTILWNWIDKNGDAFESFTSIHLTEEKEVYVAGNYALGDETFYMIKKFKDLTTVTNQIKDTENDIEIYSNPTVGLLYFETAKWRDNFEIVDCSGRRHSAIQRVDNV